MKIFIIFISIIVGAPAFSQADFVKLVNDYYRVDPFQGWFTTFYNVFKSDRALLNRKATISSAGTGLDISGQYKVFNPFSINARSIFVHLKNEGNISYYTTTSCPVYSYEIMAEFDDSPFTRNKVLNDMWFMANRFRRLYVNSKNKELRKKDMIQFEDGITFWFKDFTLLKSAEINWGLSADSGELQVTLKSYFVVNNDYAYPLGHYPSRTADHFNDFGNWRKY